jgi:hypothetical protein
LAEVQLRFEGVVRGTPKLEVPGGGLPADGERFAMVELQESRLPAASCRSDERTAPLVAGPDRTLDGGGNVTRAGSRRRRRIAPVKNGSKTRPLEVPEQQRDRLVEDRLQVAVRDDMAHQIPHAAELGVRPGADRELDSVTARRQGGHDSGPLTARDGGR